MRKQHSSEQPNIDYPTDYITTGRLDRSVYRKRRLIVALGAAASIVTGVFVGNAVGSSAPVRIERTYSQNIPEGYGAAQAAKKIEDEHDIYLNETYVGQQAQHDQTEQQGSPYMAKTSDTLVVYANENNEFISAEIITSEERKANK